MRESSGELKSGRGAGVGGGGRDGCIGSGRWSCTLLANKNRCGSRRIRRVADDGGVFFILFGGSAPLVGFMELGPFFGLARPSGRQLHRL